MSKPVPDQDRKRWAANEELDALLKARGLSITKVAERLILNRASVSQVLCGSRTGRVVWKRLGTLLTKQEWDCARLFAEAARTRRKLPPLESCELVKTQEVAL